eukprot:1778704-Rhodomonas_salina.10
MSSDNVAELAGCTLEQSSARFQYQASQSMRVVPIGLHHVSVRTPDPSRESQKLGLLGAYAMSVPGTA